VFVFFRVFDIWKPWPIRDVDHSLKGGLGIMLDDVIAALYAAACVAIVQVLLPSI
jgi:phosphatidylglycerophosphatase A